MNNHVLRKENSYHHRDSFCKVEPMIHQTQETIMVDIGISTYFTNKLVIFDLMIVHYCENGFPLWVKKHP